MTTNELCILIGSLIVYVISTLYTKYWISHAYRKGGIWESIDPGLNDVFMTLCPVLNTFFGFSVLFITTNKKARDKNKERAKKFFNV